MSSDSHIKIYARIRPVHARLRSTPGRHWVEPATAVPDASNSNDPSNFPKLCFHLPRDETQGLINNSRENYDFRFDRVFDTDTKQEEVFDVIAKPVVNNVLEGYNGTIFAYGQTGSGKTFTITGGAERYGDRGIIPRTIQYIFKEAARKTDHEFTVHVSYLEIYNEQGYDLLDQSRDAKKLEDLPKIGLQEDEDQNIHLRNLSHVPAANEEEALNLLFIGDTNRMIAETPMNPASSRSHCIFIISVTSRREGDARIRKSKLHLVDLAGSERVSRTGIEGKILKEAKYINLSLHYLEQVIIALHEKTLGKRTHIPYRNSMMTSVLRDSLGGNCKTVMVATVAVEDPYLDESISTCRFAQRVALIANNAMLNEEVDPRMVIEKLKKEVERLRAELAIARGEGDGDTDGELPEYELERVRQAVNDYIRDTSSNAELIFVDFRKIREAFRILKEYVLSGEQSSGGKSIGSSSSSDTSKPVSSKEVEKLRHLIAHRDNEINILVGLINQYKTRFGELPKEVTSSVGKVNPNHSSIAIDSYLSHDLMQKARLADTPTSTDPTKHFVQLPVDKTKAFELFRSQYPKTQWIDDQKTLLRTKYSEAKSLGEEANAMRNKIKALKSQLADSESSENSSEEEKEELRNQVSETVGLYKSHYTGLKELKIEIEHLQHLLDQARTVMTKEFEEWYVREFVKKDTPSTSEIEPEPIPRDQPTPSSTKDERVSTSLPNLSTTSTPLPPYSQNHQQQSYIPPTPTSMSTATRSTSSTPFPQRPLSSASLSSLYTRPSIPKPSQRYDSKTELQNSNSLSSLSTDALLSKVQQDISAFYKAKELVVKKSQGLGK